MQAIKALELFPFTMITIYTKKELRIRMIISRGQTFIPNLFPDYNSVTIKIRGYKKFPIIKEK